MGVKTSLQINAVAHSILNLIKKTIPELEKGVLSYNSQYGWHFRIPDNGGYDSPKIITEFEACIIAFQYQEPDKKKCGAICALMTYYLLTSKMRPCIYYNDYLKRKKVEYAQ